MVRLKKIEEHQRIDFFFSWIVCNFKNHDEPQFKTLDCSLVLFVYVFIGIVLVVLISSQSLVLGLVENCVWLLRKQGWWEQAVAFSEENRVCES